MSATRTAVARVPLVICAALGALLLLAGTAVALPSDVTRLAIIGDSITTGYAVDPGQGYAALLEADDPTGANVLALAHNGATVRTWLTTYGPELDQLTTWQPTTVLIALGGNDWYHERSPHDYTVDETYLIWQVRARVPTARVILWHYYPFGVGQSPTDCDVWPCTPSPSTWADYANADRATAILNGTGYVDTSVTAPSGQPWSAYYGPDRIHLTAAGHQQLHDAIRAALLACC